MKLKTIKCDALSFRFKKYIYSFSSELGCACNVNKLIDIFFIPFTFRLQMSYRSVLVTNTT